MLNGFGVLDLEDESDNQTLNDSKNNHYLDNDYDEGQMNIKDFFHKDTFEKFQRSLSKATGLAFVTVDYQGNPITETTFFSSFCSNVRENKAAKSRCKASDAFGALQAAVTQETSIYLCPCGLLEVAIPIIVGGQYLGGFIGGQIRCDDIPENISRFSSAMKNKEAEEHSLQFSEMLEEIPVYKFEKFNDIATMVTIIIGELCENAILQYKYEKTLKKQIKSIEKSNSEYSKLIQQKDVAIKELLLANNSFDMVDMLCTLYNISVIENTKDTSSLINTFINYYNHIFNNNVEYIPITSEMDFINNYLVFIKSKYGDRIDFSIEIKKNLNTHKMPSRVLLPYIKNALFTDLLLKKTGGKISVNGYAKSNRLIFEIVTDGVGLTDEEYKVRVGQYEGTEDGQATKREMEFALNKLKKLYGEEADISVENYKNIGQKCLIYWPEFFDERTE